MNTEPLLPPSVNVGADDCPAGGMCDICPRAGKCPKLHELQAYAEEHNMLLPAEYTVVNLPRPGQGAQGAYEGEALLPAGVK